MMLVVQLFNRELKLFTQGTDVRFAFEKMHECEHCATPPAPEPRRRNLGLAELAQINPDAVVGNGLQCAQCGEKLWVDAELTAKDAVSILKLHECPDSED